MRDLTGELIGAYEILGPLGKGGMGEVYRAKDTRLNRLVAIKALPAEFARNADLLERFAQEARATSALNHPNILTVYDIGEHRGQPYIVMELLEGAELREPLRQGPLSVRKAIDYAQQIAAGLAAAHEKGLTHRDLKPENLYVTRDGRVKILDFGLAKLQASPTASLDSEVATQRQLTTPGAVLGTVAYMSPEQVRGEAVDPRSDLFSFGLVLFEMLRGERAFQRKTMAETMAAILKDDPPELSRADAKIPLPLERLVLRCLEKEPARRFQSAGDLAFALQSLAAPSDPPRDIARPARPAARWWSDSRLAWAAAGLCLLGLLAALAFNLAGNLAGSLAGSPAGRRAASSDGSRMVQASLLPPEKTGFDFLALSPDGRWLAFTGATGGKVQLWLRALNSGEMKPFAGTEGASLPFWSPDSRFIGFFAGGRMKKVEAAGGPPVTLCEIATTPTGGAWSAEGVILFSIRGGAGIFRIPAAGGEPQNVLRPSAERQETDYHFPHFLPDGQHFLFFNSATRRETRGIYLASLDGALSERLLDDNSNVIFAASGPGEQGRLLFGRDGALMARPFDAAQRRFTGEAFSVADRVAETLLTTTGVQHWKFSASETGLLAYDPVPGQHLNRLLWIERDGRRNPPLANLQQVFAPRLSPDGRRLAFTRFETETDVWLADAAGANPSRFTFDSGVDQVPLWSPDGNRIVWASNPTGIFNLYQKAASGAGQPELLYQSDYFKFPSDWSRDGRFLLYREIHPKTKFDLRVLQLDQAKSVPYLETPANEAGGAFSPDGRWVAYASDESGRYEIYVQSFPQLGGKRQVSTAGGFAPRWRGDGRELFYHAPDGKLMAAPVRAGTGFESDAPVPLFEFRAGGNLTNTYYDVTSDGQRFLLSTVPDAPAVVPITLLINWKGE